MCLGATFLIDKGTVCFTEETMTCAETHWMWLFQHKCAFLLKKIPMSTLGTMALVVHNLIVSKPQEKKHTLCFAKEDLPLSFSCGPGFMTQG